MSRPRRWRGGALAVTLLAGFLWPAPPAEAHASLVRSTPAHRAVLGRMPERVHLWFNERLEPAYSSVSVWNAAGAQVDARDATVGPDDPRRLSVTVETRESGLYTVTYRVLSVDGHIVEDRFTFTVKASR
ncbi:MAG TPA: copper resistance CopC family protein [Candidatus Limnocylindria bacterium]|nr:copper resistance CopC family protein [Candidatus Limnocylindria bacterium]